MIRKILAVIISFCMVLTAAPVAVRAEEPVVREITTAQQLSDLFATGGKGKLEKDISGDNYSFAEKTPDIDMNGHSISVSTIFIGNSAVGYTQLTLTGNGQINISNNIYITRNSMLSAGNNVIFSGEILLEGYGSTINGGTYNGEVRSDWYGVRVASISGGVFNGIVSDIADIDGGTFNVGSIINNSTINSGTFNAGSAINSSTINGGTFNAGSLIRNSVINGGTIYGAIDVSCTVSDSAKVTVTFNSNGGSSVQTQEILRGQKVTEPEPPTRDGFIFGGWHNGNNAAYDFDQPVTENLTLTASWIKDINDLTISDIPDQTYSGSDLTPGVTMKDGEYTLVEGTDYTVTYSNNHNAGTAAAVITGIGSYNGSVTKTFTISKADPSLSVEAVSTKTYSDEDFQLNVSRRGDGVISYSSDNPAVLTVSDKGLVHIAGAGTASITVNLAESTNYTAATDTLSITVDKANGRLNIQNAGINKVYGDADFSVAPGEGATSHGTVAYSSSDEKVVTVNEQGTVHIVGAGTATITLKLEEGSNHTEVTETITINVKAASRPSTPSTPSIPSPYSITAPTSTEHGTVTVDRKSATPGTRVTITTTPDKGFALEVLSVTAGHRVIDVTNNNDNTHTFVMPSGDVTITAVFADDNRILHYFTDVDPAAYYFEPVLWAAENGITSGTSETTFSPEDPATRAQMVTFLWNLAGAPETDGEMPFEDVGKDQYYYKAVLWAYRNGVTAGTSATTFSPDVTCTRGHAATFLHNYSKEEYDRKDSGFSDVSDQAYYASSVAWMKKNGITSGTSETTYSPDEPCRRGQVVTFLWNYQQKK